MYLPPDRRRDSNGVAGAHARQVSADSHSGSRKDFLRRHATEAAEAARSSYAVQREFAAVLFLRTADLRNLRLAWDYLFRNGGQAPGLDGLHYHDLSEPEVWNLLHTVREALLNDVYRVAPERHVQVPKASGNGTRTLTILSIVDRLVQRAITQVIQPFLDPNLDDHSLGFRPGRNTFTALTQAEKLAVEGNRWIWIAEDLKDAFNHVPQGRLLDLLNTRFPDERMRTLMERVIRTKTGRGIRQGANLGPMLLNVYLDHVLDRKWRRLFPNIPLLRWADDLLIMCKSKEEAIQTYEGMSRLLLPTGMKLKGTPATTIKDVSKEGADWLGYTLVKQDDQMKVYVAKKAWKQLGRKLEAAYLKNDPSLRANDAIKGWIGYLGPTYPQTDMRKAYTKIQTLAHTLAFDEVPSLGEVQLKWRMAHTRWSLKRQELMG
jgi:RNA-directed DNA polymerase